MSELSFGQRIDPESGLVQPWFTHGALDKIAAMDLSEKVVWMWGAGRGDIWLAKRCKELHVVEREQKWIYDSLELATPNGVTNLWYYHRPCADCSGMDAMYCEIHNDIKPDVIIVDDAYRYECIVKALEYKPCTLIIDNWMQAFVFMCPAGVELLKDYPQEIFEQADHEHHDGVNKWKTAIFYL